MFILAYIPIIQVVLGATILFVSLTKYLNILKSFKEVVQAKTLFSSWIYLASILLIIFFFIGYVVVAIWFILSEHIDIMQLLVGSVFFFGAIFVYLMVKVAKQMLRSLSSESHLREEKEHVEQVSAAKSEFLSRVSHEMRTPMNAIIGMSNIGKNSDDIEKKDYCFDHIASASSHLIAVINHVLTISKLSKGADFDYTSATDAIGVDMSAATSAVVASEPIAQGEQTEGCFSHLRIILADDVELNREIVRCLLEPTLINIVEAENGQEATELFAADPEVYDLILMDIQMPEMDGLSATKAIRELAHPKAKIVPIIAMTANVFTEDINRYRLAGMDGCISKPLDMDTLIGRVRDFTGPAARAV